MDAIIDKYGFKEGLTTKGGKITNWPYKQRKPSQKSLALIIEKYESKIAYKEKRKYPSIEEQLDMLYKDKINGTDSWSTAITAVKTQYPKPS